LPVVTLLAAGVIAVPVFKRLGLGSVLGYLTAGVVIGPFGLALFSEPETILHIAELGVVMFLFVIGLEMEPSRLWGLRKQIFGVGAMQVAMCGGLLTALGILFGFSPAAIHPRRSARTPSLFCCSRTSPSCRCSRSSRCWHP
jgi:glutathione-regulated potassium-efflux system protein KefB